MSRPIALAYAAILLGAIFVALPPAALPLAGATVPPGSPVTNLAPLALPSARDETSAVWDGHVAYVFGGQDAGVYLSQIVKFTPGVSATALATALPSGRSLTSAVWTGSTAYVFGGYGTSGFMPDIVKFDPAAGTATTLPSPAVLPAGLMGTAAIWDGREAFVFGGYGSSGEVN